MVVQEWSKKGEITIDKLLKVKDIQEKIGCSKQTAYDLVRLKGFPKLTIGRRYYIPEEEFNQWIKNNLTAKILLH